MTASWRIRKAIPQDEKRIRDIADASYSIYLERMDRKPFPMLDDYATHIVNGTIFVLEDDKDIQGYVVLLPAEDGTLLLDNVAVDANCQKRGYGRASQFRRGGGAETQASRSHPLHQ